MSEPITHPRIQFISEEEHILRMAKVIYGASNRRLTVMRGWGSLSYSMQSVFLELARRVVEQVEGIKRDSRDRVPVASDAVLSADSQSLISP